MYHFNLAKIIQGKTISLSSLAVATSPLNLLRMPAPTLPSPVPTPLHTTGRASHILLLQPSPPLAKGQLCSKAIPSSNIPFLFPILPLKMFYMSSSMCPIDNRTCCHCSLPLSRRGQP